MSTSFAGSLFAKRKADLVEIAQALGLEATEGKITDLVKAIQQNLEANEAELSKSSIFKGLYGKKGRHDSHDDSETPAFEIKAAANDTVKKGRKSLIRALDKVVDAADIPLPDSPLNLNRIQNTARDSMAVALAPARHLTTQDLTTQIHKYSNELIKFGKDGQRRVDFGVGFLRKRLSTPENLILSAIGIELLLTLVSTKQFYDHAFFFPPAGGSKGSIDAFLHSLFFWVPSITFNLRLPELRSVRYGTGVWSMVMWWLFTTIVPPWALSTLISFSPHKAQSHRPSHSPRHSASHSPAPQVRPDPLAFSIFRLAILLYPLTTAAPSILVDSLEIGGDLQVRALGAGLLVALIVAHRLT